MKLLTSICVGIALLPSILTPAGPQDKTELQHSIERILKENEPGWLCKKNMPEGDPGTSSPGVSYTFDCRYKEQQANQVTGSIVVLNSKQDAITMLDRSQMMLQVNASKPQDGIGEQAYAYAGHGSAWVTFRKGNVFGQINVGIIDPRTVADPSPEMDVFTKEAFEVARKFAFDLAQYTGAT
jgi:hypothetical protein